MRVANHIKQRLFFLHRLSVCLFREREGRAEDVVSAVLRLNLRKHEQKRVRFVELKVCGFRSGGSEFGSVVAGEVGDVDGMEAETGGFRVGSEGLLDQVAEFWFRGGAGDVGREERDPSKWFRCFCGRHEWNGEVVIVNKREA